MMLWLVVMSAACALTAAHEQLVACSDDLQCISGYFCRTDDHYCRECLRCEDLHRQPPRGPVSCVRFFSECGQCLKGYVDDRMGPGCMEPESAAAVAWYLWLVVALVIACLLVCAIGVVVYALRNTDSFRVLASTNTSVEAPVGKPMAPTAPQPPQPPQPSQPPPYNYSAPYEPVRPSSPSPDANPPVSPYARGDYAYRPTPDSVEAERPLVKRAAGAGAGAGGAGRAARESAGSQSARVYTNPAYVRNVPPPSYDSAFSDDSDHEQGPFQPHDEETMPSDWTPAAAPAQSSAAGSAEAAGGAASGSAAVARRPARDQPASPPPNKMRCVEDSNNNHSAGSSGSAQPPPPAPAPHVVINVLNVNAVHQRNDVTL